MKKWYSIIGYEGLYEVSATGEVKSLITKKPRKLVKHKNGYLQVMLVKNRKLKMHSVHRLVINSINGFDSHLEVDHINGIKDDNRIDNLRYCTRRENEHFKKRTNKTSQYLGVRKFRNKWRAHIGVNGKSLHLGTFQTEIEASLAYQKELKKIIP